MEFIKHSMGRTLFSGKEIAFDFQEGDEGMRGFDYLQPHSLDEAFELAEGRDSVLFSAGCTDVLVKIKNGAVAPRALISLRRVPGLSGVAETPDGGVRIGALTTISHLLRDGTIRTRYPVLAAAAGRLGSEQIRNAATVGGNICNASPCADTALPLLVLGARVVLRSSGGVREKPLNEFFAEPGRTHLAVGEILEAVLLPPPVQGATGVFFKKGRVRLDLAVASLAALLVVENGVCRYARLAAGSVAPVPLRLTGAEALLEGESLTGKTAAMAALEAMREVSPITDIRASAWYRMRITGVFVKRAFERLYDSSGSDV